ncbi:hypothetical protein RGU70_05930 [Herbaspirillum sp. RTI4]|uniref:hypothetical protein n=1 Tax=Herbaspirillum sp. RTI4 TaxID=3048640 RepID=UPI002AB3804F|nr:hypothetical protein [Herbaspirillum sp. RTI4]MDY7577857.1 hypothetical protein [Herbaspirillum sp. RTI4]MEA9982475.1 hypothetical protein [Herbaspirillum sp. RTI4]
MLCPAPIRSALLVAALMLGCSLSAHSQQVSDDSWWQQIKNKASDISDNGDDALYVSGLAHHGRSTYTPEKLAELNEHAWGLGYGKTLRNASGNDESLYGFVLRDSHKHPQYMAGYSYEWIWAVGGSPLEVGLGGTMMLMSRQDYLNSVPFPVPLPVASIGVRHAKVMFAYVPRLSANKNNGDVLLVFSRIVF